MNNIDWDKRIEFTGSASQYPTSISTVLSYKELFIILGTLMLTCSSAYLLRFSFSETIFGYAEKEKVLVNEYDFNSFLLQFSASGMVELSDSIEGEGKKINLTEDGEKYLYENRNALGIEFCAKLRQDAKTVIQSQSAKKNRKESSLERSEEL